MGTAWLRFAYACEFLLAVIASLTLWSEVGGQGHLDLMPWYAKLLLVCGISAAIVGLTAAIGREERMLNRRAVTWAVIIILLAVAMGGITFYYHLHENVDEPDEEGTTACALLSLEARL